jgi:predicted TIM-barrel fold metal-dependent hydrolase
MNHWRKRMAAIAERNLVHDAWLAQVEEEIIDPDLAIIDPHHHIWVEKPSRTARYLIEEILDDFESGHNVKASVYVQSTFMYRQDGDEALKSVGETEFVNGVAAMSASGAFGPIRVADGIVGYADLMLGGSVERVLEAHMRAAGRRFKGIRYMTCAHADDRVRRFIRRPVPEGLMYDALFREGFAKLGPLGLSFDIWMYFPQLADAATLAKSYPDTTMVMNHTGGVLGIGPHADRAETFCAWKTAVSSLAKCENVSIKLGGLAMKTVGFDFDGRQKPPSSVELAAAWKPYFETCIELFGVHRCMFESNFPVDRDGCGYAILWNAFKRIVHGCSDAEKQALFFGTAAHIYRLSIEPN